MKLNSTFFRRTHSIQTPFIVYDLEKIKKNYHSVTRTFSNVSIFYAMKANSHPRVLQALDELNAGFEVASLSEAKQIVSLGVKSKNIMCLHPIKSPQFLTYLQKHRIDIMAVDSFEEVDKIAKYAPKAKLVIRISVDNLGSGWALNGKFGIDAKEANRLLNYIVQKKLIAYGVTFHVGSQCLVEKNWTKALAICSAVWKEAAKSGISLSMLSLGGGLAVRYTKPALTLAHTGHLVAQSIRKRFAGHMPINISIEPGRAIVATAGVLVTSVMGIATRDKKHWLYIETGTYNGLVEAIETPDRQFYPIKVENNTRPRKTYSIGGPSCVSLDTPFEHMPLPEMKLNERLYIQNCGAYTTGCASPFNGFPIPKEYIWEDLYAHNA